MSIDRIILAVAGTFVLISALLGMFYSHYWLYFTMFVGANLLQSAFTGRCPMAMILKKLGVQSGAAF